MLAALIAISTVIGTAVLSLFFAYKQGKKAGKDEVIVKDSKSEANVRHHTAVIRNRAKRRLYDNKDNPR
jgi:hypothetical protein